MKSTFLLKSATIVFSFLLTVQIAFSQSVAINTDGSTADNSALLDVKSTIKGVLIPRMTTVERTSITSPATGLLVFDNDAASFWFYNGANWIELGSGGAGGFWTANGTDVYNNNAGKVGIGTSTPLQPLTVQTAAGDYGFSHTDGTITMSSFVGGSINGGWLGTVSNHPLSIYTNNGSAQVIFNTNYATDFKGAKSMLRLYDGTQESGSLRTSGLNMEVNAYRASVLTGLNGGNLLLQAPGSILGFPLNVGNVGIGVSDPSMKLEVGGRTRIRSQEVDGLTAGIWFNNYANTQSIGFIGEAGNGAPNHLGIFGSTSGWSFVMNTVTGNVGIGKFNPENKLDVNGTARAKEVVVETGWADYVFDKKYKLSSLKEVEDFIKANKHLPGITPAKEIQEKGLNVGAMQTKMMEKIEELTLYMIEMNKELKTAKEEIEQLKEKLRNKY